MGMFDPKKKKSDHCSDRSYSGTGYGSPQHSVYSGVTEETIYETWTKCNGSSEIRSYRVSE